MTDLQSTININFADQASAQAGFQAMIDHVSVLHKDVGALTRLLALTLILADHPDPKRSLAVRLSEAAEDMDERAAKALREFLKVGGGALPPKGGSHLRVVVSNEPTQAKAA